MLQESLLLFACINGSGCSETANVYALNNKDIVKQYTNVYNSVKNTAPNAIFDIGIPILGFYYRQKASFVLNKYLTTEVSNENIAINYTFKF